MRSTEKHSNMLQTERKHVIHIKAGQQALKNLYTVKTLSIKLTKSDCTSRHLHTNTERKSKCSYDAIFFVFKGINSQFAPLCCKKSSSSY